MSKHIDVFLAKLKGGNFVFDKQELQFANGCTIGGVDYIPHAIEYADTTFQILYPEKLTGEELKKMENDWRRYCSH